MRAFKFDLLTLLTIIVVLGVITTMTFENRQNKQGFSKEKASKIQAKVLKSSKNTFEFVSTKPKKASNIFNKTSF